MKRLALLSALLAVLVGIFVVTAPGLVSIPAVRRSIAREIAGWGGSALSFDGTPTVAFRPYLTLSFPQARIVSARTGDILVSMDLLSAQIPLLPLILGGNIEPTAFDFRRPVFHFDIDAAGRLNWTLPSALDSTTRVERVRIRDGALHLRDSAGHHIDIDSIDAKLNWPGTAGAASLRGRANWQGQTGDVSASIDSLRDFFQGKASTVALSLASKPFSFRFSGQAQQLDGVVASGDVSAELPSIRDVAALFGSPLPDRAAYGAAALKGNLSFTRGIARIADTTLSLDGNEGEGVLALDLTDVRPALHATLAFDDLEIAPFLQLASAGISSAQQQPDQAFDLAAMSAVDLDIRLSADRLLADGKTIGRVAGSAALRAGRLDVALADLRLFDGRLSASLTADGAAATPSAGLDLRFEALPLKSVPLVLSPLGEDGIAKGEMQIAASGRRWSDAVKSISGSGDMTVEGGTIEGLDLAALQRSVADPAANSARIHSRSTGYDVANFDYSFDARALRIEKAGMKGSGYTVSYSGTRSLVDGLYSLDGVVEFPDGGPSGKLPFVVDGKPGLADLEFRRPASPETGTPPQIAPAAPSTLAVPQPKTGTSGL